MKNLILLCIITIALVGCGPAKVLPLENINPNETAFVIPIESNGKDQEKFESIEFLTQHKVVAKRIEIPVRERSTGRMWWDYEWIPTVRVIKVDRSLVTREWVHSKAEGKNQPMAEAIPVESLDSIGFRVGINITAFITEENAATYLYYHTSKPLSEVIDQNVRGYVQDRLAQKFGALKLEECKAKKGAIFEEVSKETIANFAKYGITIATVGNAGGLEFEDAKIQDSIDATARAEMSIEIARKSKLAQDQQNELEASKADNENKILIARAVAQRQASEEFDKARAAQESRVRLEIERIKAEAEFEAAKRWNGDMPNSIVPAGSPLLFGLDTNK